VSFTWPHTVQMQYLRARRREREASMLICTQIARALLVGALRLAVVAKTLELLLTSFTARCKEVGTLRMTSRTIFMGREVGDGEGDAVGDYGRVEVGNASQVMFDACEILWLKTMDPG
jgi:hypothetical protein